MGEGGRFFEIPFRMGLGWVLQDLIQNYLLIIPVFNKHLLIVDKMLNYNPIQRNAKRYFYVFKM